MATIRCPACGQTFSLESQSPEGKVTCPGCKKTYALKKREPGHAAASHSAAAHPPPHPAAEGAVPAENPSPAPRAAHPAHPAHPGHPRPVLRGRSPLQARLKAAPTPGAKQTSLPAVPAAAPEAGEEFPEGEGVGKPGIPKEKLLLLIGAPAGILMALILVILFVMMNRKAAQEDQRLVADQVLNTLSVKWLLEGEGVKECEAIWKFIRSPENAAHLAKLDSKPEDRDLGLRAWMYDRRSRSILLKVDELLGRMDPESIQLLDAKAVDDLKNIGVRLEIHDIALDWLTYRGYRMLENLKRGSPGASASEGAVVKERGSGSVKMAIFGASLQAEFDPRESTIDVDEGVGRAGFRTNYPEFYGQGPAGVVQVPARRREQLYILDFRDDIQDYIQNSGKWWTKAFDATAGKP